MPGPAPKSNAIRIAEGKRAHRPLRNEPNHARGMPEMPKGMSKPAARVWERLTEDMDPLILRRTDQDALAQLCENEAQLAEGYAGLRAQGGPMFALMQTKEGAAAMRALRSLERNVIVQRREFGLTPASRTRVSADSIKDDMDVISEAMFGNIKTERLA